MKDFLLVLRRFVPPYKKYLIWSLALNLLSAILKIFSFTLLIPILQILFRMNTKVYHYMSWGFGDMKQVLVNNFYYYIQQLIVNDGA